MNDSDRRVLNGVRAYNLSRSGTSSGWTAKMWYDVLMASGYPTVFPHAAMTLGYYGVEPA